MSKWTKWRDESKREREKEVCNRTIRNGKKKRTKREKRLTEKEAKWYNIEKEKDGRNYLEIVRLRIE